MPSASSSMYASPVCAACRAASSAASRCRCCITPPSSDIFRCRLTALCIGVCRFQASGFPGQFTSHQYVVGIFSSRQIGHDGCFSRQSPISDGSRAQPKQARLSSTPEARHPRGSGWCCGGGRSCGGGRRGGRGLGGLALLRLQRRQRLAHLLVARGQVGLLLPQLGEQRLGAELGMSQVKPADDLQEAIVGLAAARRAPPRRLKEEYGTHAAEFLTV